MSSPPTDPFTALGEAMTTLGVAIFDATDKLTAWAGRHPLLFIAIALVIGALAGGLAYLVAA